MKIAIISDIHGNLDALEEVLRDIDEKGVDEVYSLGDLVGYLDRPSEVVTTMETLKIKGILGNNDEDAISKKCRGDLIKKWTYNSLSKENVAYLKELPREINLEHGPIRIKLVHGSPKSNREYLYKRADNTIRYMEDLEEDILVAGHTHMPYVDFHKGKMIVNPGSVGKPDTGKIYSNYAILRIDGDKVEAKIESVEYDNEEVAKRLIEKGFPMETVEKLRGF